MSVSAWFKAEILLARARLAMKVEDDQLKIEAKLRKTMASMIGPIVNGIIDALVNGGTLAFPANVVTAQLTAAIQPLADVAEPLLLEAAVLDARVVTGNPDFAIEDFSPKVRDLIKVKAFEASQRTLNALVGDINTALSDAYAAGLGIDDAAQQLKGIFNNLKDWELERIARTEINSAQNIAAAQTIRDLDIDYHQWIATLDDRVRETHEELHGTIVRVGALFPNGLEYPGDTRGAPEEFINCRCRIRPFIMPSGFMAPVGRSAFREGDLVAVG